MRPELLKIAAFGPYVQEQVIDFSAFADHHLFLIRGETGSGKTMLLDAMTYALYGKSSGGQREEFADMRSRFAKDSQKTYVDFRFSVHGKTYRFYRSVEVIQHRNGESSLRVRVDAGEWIQDTFYPFFENPGVRKIEEKACELIGLTHAQFVQVMILPQGKFEELLTSNSEKKQEILRTLFQMERWQRVSERLGDVMKQKRDALEAMRSKKQALLDSVQLSSMEEWEHWLQDTAQHILQYQHQEQAESKQLEQLREDISQQQLRAQHAQQYTKALQQLTALQQQEQEMACLQQTLQRQRRLQSYQPQYLTYQESKERMKAREGMEAACLQEVNQLQAQRNEEPLLLQAIQEALAKEEELQKQIHHFEELAPQVNKRTHCQQQLKQQQEVWQQGEIQLAAKQEQALRLEAACRQLQADIKKLEEQLQDLQDVEEQYALWKQAAYHAQEQEGLLHQQQQLKQQLQQLQQKREAQEALLLPLQKDYEEAMRRYLASSASQLAATLKEQEPCPVCGSIHHPKLAHMEEAYQDVVAMQNMQTRLDEEREKQARCMQECDHIQSNLQLIQDAISKQQKAITELLPIPFSKTAYEHVQQRKQLWDRLKQQLATAQSQVQQQAADVLACKEAQQSQAMQITYTKQQLQDIQQQLPVDLIDMTTLQQRLHSTQEQLASQREQRLHQEETCKQLHVQYATAMQKLKSAQEETRNARQQLKESEAIWQGIQMREQIAEAEMQIKEADMAQKEQRLQAYHKEVQESEAIMKQSQQIMDSIPWQDLEQLMVQLQEKEASIKQIRQQLADHTSKQALYQKLFVSAQKLGTTLAQEEPKFVRLSQFVKQLRGDQGISIERYVLGVMFNSITEQANQLLKLVHNGRYQIYRSDTASGKVRKAGLELSIYDSYNAATRSVVSLSGGEKFLVSLALALALSSSVQARNGGIHLDAMFIDEGFGTLDEHSIADALAVLQVMSNRKGYVGIISHVELLKENLPYGIEVTKTRNGSEVHIRRE